MNGWNKLGNILKWIPQRNTRNNQPFSWAAFSFSHFKRHIVGFFFVSLPLLVVRHNFFLSFGKMGNMLLTMVQLTIVYSLMKIVSQMTWRGYWNAKWMCLFVTLVLTLTLADTDQERSHDLLSRYLWWIASIQWTQWVAFQNWFPKQAHDLWNSQKAKKNHGLAQPNALDCKLRPSVRSWMNEIITWISS